MQILLSLKDTLSLLSSNGIYNISCSGGAVCISETSRSIKTWLSEHKHYLKFGFSSKSAFAKHEHETGHQIIVGNFMKDSNNFNRDIDYLKPSVWKTDLKPYLFNRIE